MRELKLSEVKLPELNIPQAVACILLISALSLDGAAQSGKAQAGHDKAEIEITSLLREFLGHVTDPAMHERFWAEDVVYTSAAGKVRAKPEIVKNVRDGQLTSKPGEPVSTFGAEDISVRVYGQTAVLTFKLVHHIGEKTEYYRNTGTLLHRDGKWQVVAWQATKISDL